MIKHYLGMEETTNMSQNLGFNGLSRFSTQLSFRNEATGNFEQNEHSYPAVFFGLYLGGSSTEGFLAALL